MICLPNLNLVNFDNDKEEKKIIYDAIYDIFMAMPDDNTLSKYTYTAKSEEVAQIYKEKEDILDYAECPKDQEVVQKEIVDVMTEKTIFSYIGFEIVSKNTTIFINRFVQQQNLKSQLLQMIRTCRSLENKQQYIMAVQNIPESQKDTLVQFKTNLQSFIEQQQFNEMVDNLFSFVGSIFQTYFNGTYRINNFTLPPLVGIEQDMLELFHDNQLQDKIVNTVNGAKIIRMSNNPYIKFVIRASARVYINYSKLEKEKKQQMYLAQHDQKLLQQQQMRQQQLQQLSL